MQDRAPTKPNRYAVYDDAHNFLRYEYHERADEPTQVGDALNKANLLPDAVATALGLTGNPQVKDALSKVKILIDGNTTLANSKAQIATGSYTGTGAFGSDNPNSLTFDFAPKILWIYAQTVLRNNGYLATDAVVANISLLTTGYAAYGAPYANNPESAYSKKSADSKTITWYNTASANAQLNDGNRIFYYLAIG